MQYEENSSSDTRVLTQLDERIIKNGTWSSLAARRPKGRKSALIRHCMTIIKLICFVICTYRLFVAQTFSLPFEETFPFLLSGEL